MCCCDFCVLLLCLAWSCLRISACQPGPIYLSFLMAVYIISFFLEIHKFIPLNLVFFFCKVCGEICCISKISLKTGCISELKPAFSTLRVHAGSHWALQGIELSFHVFGSKRNLSRRSQTPNWRRGERGIKRTEYLIFLKSHISSITAMFKM